MFTPLTLPNGSRLTNRLAKAAMEESGRPGPTARPGAVALIPLLGRRRRRLDHHRQRDDRRPRHDRPRRRGAGTRHAARPFETWAKAARQGGAQVWMQLNHPGRQVMANMGGNAWAPSAIRWRWGTASCSPSRRRWIKRRSPRLSRASPPARTPPNGPVLPAWRSTRRTVT